MLELLYFFGAGLLLSLTPCIWPTLPIISAYVTKGKKYNLLIYVMSAALTYASMGAIVALTGLYLQAYFQNPWVIMGSMVFLVGLAFIQFDLIKLNYWNILNIIGHTQIGPVLLGIFSVLVLSPCATPALGLAVGYIATTGNAVIGFLQLFVLSLGMNIPLIIVGFIGHKAMFKGSKIMKYINYFLGILFLATALSLYPRISFAYDMKSVQRVEAVSVTVYSAEWCPACKSFEANEVPVLRASGVSVRIVDVTNGPSMMVPKIVAKGPNGTKTYIGYTSARTILTFLGR